MKISETKETKGQSYPLDQAYPTVKWPPSDRWSTENRRQGINYVFLPTIPFQKNIRRATNPPAFDRQTKQLWGSTFQEIMFRVYGSLNNQGGKLGQSEPVGWVADLRPGDPTWTID